MIEDIEDFDELPPITVNSSGRDSSRFSMPSAAEVAEQRARAEHCERELRRLREHAAGPGLAHVAHSDSSGSEGEAALAAAAAALAVRCAARRPAPRLAALLPALPPALPEYARAAAALPPRVAAHVAHRTLRRLAGARGDVEGEAARAAAAWLCLALAAAERAQLGCRLTRAAHAALERLPAAEAPALASSLAAALGPARARLRVADALRGGAGTAAALAAALSAGVPDAADEEETARRWRRLEPAERLAALAAWGRVRAHGSPYSAAAAARALRAAQPPRDHRLDSLKVQVAASKLQVLFPDKK